jgi:hypothetical protein
MSAGVPATRFEGGPTYAVDSALWARWFEAEHEERRAGIEAYLEDLDDEDVDYEAYKEADTSPTYR